MRPITVVLILVAVLAAGGAVVTANKMIQNRANAAAEQHELAKRDVEVLVAAKDVPQGRVLRESDLRWDKWPIMTADPKRVILRIEGQNNLAHLPASATRRPLLMGEPITSRALFTPGKGAGFMSGMIEPGKKAVGITVTAASSASGFVLPGDLVDVILTVDLDKAEVNLPEAGRFASQTILHQVKVLAVDQALNPGAAPVGKKKAPSKVTEKDAKTEDASQEEVAIVGKTVAIEVMAGEAERVMAAQATGTLSLSLRSLAVSEQLEGETTPALRDARGGFRSATGSGVKLIKGGEIVR